MLVEEIPSEPLFKVRDWTSPVFERCLTNANTKLIAGSIGIDERNRYLYARGGTSNGSIQRWDLDSHGYYNAIETGAGTNVVTDSFYFGWYIRLGHTDPGFDVAPDGSLAVSGGMLPPTGTADLNLKYFNQDETSAPWAPLVLNTNPFVGAKFDLKGNLYSALYDGPPESIPVGYELDPFYQTSNWNPFISRIYKYTPTGSIASGNLYPVAPGAAAKVYDIPYGMTSPRQPASFGVDGYGRICYPTAISQNVTLIDNEGNEILRFGTYGNADSKGGLSGELVPTADIPLAYGHTVDISDDFIYVGDLNNNRVLRVAMRHSREELLPIFTNVPPVAGVVASPVSGIAPLDVHFDASVSSDADGAIADYSWSFGDGANGSGVTTDHTYAVSGSYAAQLTVTDNRGATDSIRIDISVSSAPLVVATSALPDATAGRVYAAVLAASGGTPPYTWSLASGSDALPAGLSLDPATGTIGGTPTTPGTFSPVVQVADSATPAMTATQTLGLTVAYPPLVIATASLPEATLDNAYAATLTAGGGTPPYTWSLASGSDPLPAGLNLDPATGEISGTPTTEGVARLSVQVTDAASPAMTAIQPLGLSVTRMNNAPVAVDDISSTTYQTTVLIDVLTNDFDADGTALLIDSFDVTSLNGGSVSCTDSCSYTPASGFSGTDSFTYRASDGALSSNSATVSVAVEQPLNLAPVANDDSYSIDQDAVLNVTAPGVLQNDRDTDGPAALTATLVANPTSGNLVLGSDGQFRYTSNPGFAGSDTFTYTAFDGYAISNVATVSIRVNPVVANTPPVANDDMAGTPSRTAVEIDVLSNDTDADAGDTLLIGTFSPTSVNGGTVACVNTCTYTPAGGFAGSDTFTYQASDGSLLSNIAVVTVMVAAPAANTVYFSTLGNTYPPGVAVTADDADIYSWDGERFARVLDASALGVPTATVANVDGLSIQDGVSYLSFAADVTIRGVTYQDEDILAYAPDTDTWSLYFDGTVKGLTAANLDIDDFDVADGVLYFSTQGNTNPPGVTGTADDADVYRWDGAGFARVLDASAVGVPTSTTANLDGLSVRAGVYYLSFTTDVTIRGVTYQDEDILAYVPDTDTWSLHFDGTANGLTAGNLDIDALHLH